MLFKSRSLQAILCVLLLINFTTAFAVTQHTNPRITYTASQVNQMPAKHQSILAGNVKISVGEKIKIFGDKALVKYKNKKITEFIIYGEGTLTNGKQVLQFKNATYYPQTGRLTAEETKRIE